MIAYLKPRVRWMGFVPAPDAPRELYAGYDASKTWLYKVVEKYQPAQKAAVSAASKDDSSDVLFKVTFALLGKGSNNGKPCSFKKWESWSSKRILKRFLS